MAFLPKILVDAHDYRESVMTVLRKFEREGGITTYSEDTDPEDPERFEDKTRTQSAYRTFQEFCTFPTVLHGAQMYAYNLFRDTLPEDSAWASALKEISPPSPTSPVLGERVIHPRVFYMYVARVWRDLVPEIKRVFYAVSAIRALAVGACWVEHLWDFDHPQAEGIRDETIAMVDLARMEENFGILKLTGPYTIRSLKRLGVRSDPGDSTLNIPRWNVPIFSQTYTYRPTQRTLFLTDPYYGVFFWVYMPDQYRLAILPLLTGVPSREVPHTPPRRKDMSARTPGAPILSRVRYHDDLLDSVAARVGGSSYRDSALAISVASLQREGLVPDTPEGARGFIEQFRAFVSGCFA